MFKAIQALVALSFLSLATSQVVASPSSATFKRDNATYCPYYSPRSLSTRQNNGNSLSFTGSQWIWTNEFNNGVAPIGTRAFRKTFSPPEGKTPSSLKVAFAVDNGATLFVNGQAIAAEGNWFAAGTYCVPLKPCTNVIGFSATNAATVPNPAGLLVTAEVTYTDGSTSHIASDVSWRTSGPNIPNGWEQLSFDDSSWATAISEGPYPNALYGSIPIGGSDAISIARANWIWTDELPAAAGAVPVGARAFRRVITLPPGQIAQSAQILIAADNEYSIYINGRFVGTGNGFHAAHRFTVTNIPDANGQVVVAVYGVNGPTATSPTAPNPASLLASVQVTSINPDYGCLKNCSSVSSIVTDGQWKANHGTPSGFEKPGFDDSTWTNAVIEGGIGMAPWAPVTADTTDSAPGTPLPGAPAGN
ncbi:hypothetical protein D9758_013477 [Tetrapyrgos nigripes]|uniref:Lectin n=1 Tax=Tetrapyrgos nigripes TaxID=182062 RepID=A0A8H5FS03_9AGAR|nr:hypothetical protein D9758_013477 [Tetrapyrgos nigripes]